MWAPRQLTGGSLGGPTQLRSARKEFSSYWYLSTKAKWGQLRSESMLNFPQTGSLEGSHRDIDTICGVSLRATWVAGPGSRSSIRFCFTFDWWGYSNPKNWSLVRAADNLVTPRVSDHRIGIAARVYVNTFPMTRIRLV
jgi:hypothetical protein